MAETKSINTQNKADDGSKAIDQKNPSSSTPPPGQVTALPYDGRPLDAYGKPLPYGFKPGGVIVPEMDAYFESPEAYQQALTLLKPVTDNLAPWQNLKDIYETYGPLLVKRGDAQSWTADAYNDFTKAPPAVQHAAALNPSAAKSLGQNIVGAIDRAFDEGGITAPFQGANISLVPNLNSENAQISQAPKGSAAAGVESAQASINQAATTIQNTTPDLTQANAYGAQQQAAINQIQGMANGTGPNPAAIALAQAQQAGLASLASAGATASTGSSPGLAGRGIAAQQGALQAQIGAQGALAQANQQQQAIYTLADVTGQAQANQYNQALGLAGFQAGVQTQAAGLFGASAALGQSQQQMDQGYELSLASLSQDWEKFAASLQFQEQQASQSFLSSLWTGIVNAGGSAIGKGVEYFMPSKNKTVDTTSNNKLVSPGVSQLGNLANTSNAFSGAQAQSSGQLQQPVFGASAANGTSGASSFSGGNNQLSYSPVY